ncbi:MAG: hypothetical protein RIT45_47 [Pseudomonadota bacterium]
MRSLRWQIATMCAVLLALAGGCGEDALGGKDADGTTADTAVGGSDTGGGVDVASGDTSSEPDVPKVEVPDTGSGSTEGAFEQWTLPGEPNVSLHACATEGTTRAYLAGSNGTLIGWNGSAWSLLSEGAFHTLHGIAAAGSLVHAAGIAGTVIQAKQSDGGLGEAWGAPGGCTASSECDDKDPCTSDWCDAGSCRHTSSGAAGCCGSKPLQDAFASLGGWTVTDLYESVADKGGLVWTSIAMNGKDGKPRYTSPPKALYFGRVDAPCAGDASKLCPTFDNGKVVGSLALSPSFTIPKAPPTDKVLLTFQLFLDVENGVGYDALTLKIVQGSKKTEIWNKDAIGGGGSTEGTFVVQAVDLTTWAGKTVQLEIGFDSKDDSINDGEGVFIDDLAISTTCKAGDTATKGLTEATFFDVWAADDSNAWAVGTDGAIARWDGEAWAMQTGSATRDILAMDGFPGKVALGVGQKGLAMSLAPGGVGDVQVGTQVDLVDVAVDGSAASGATTAVALTKSTLAYEFDGTVWKPVSLGGAIGMTGVEPLGDGGWVAVGGNKIYERTATSGWTAKSTSVLGVLTDVASLGGGVAFAVGSAGLLYKRSGGTWAPEGATLGLANFTAIDASSADEAWAVGDGGMAAHWNGKTWSGTNTGTGKNLTDVWSGGPGVAWAVGLAGILLRWDGSKWATVESPLKLVDWTAVWGSDPSDVYIAGKGGLVVRWDGLKFTVLAAPVVGTVRDVWGFSATDVWAVGDAGRIFHSTGGAWTQVPIDPFKIPDQPDYLVESDLYAIWGAAPDDIWAAGAPDSNGHGVLVHYDGKSWKYVQALSKETRVVRAIGGWSKDHMLLAGTQGMVYRYDGSGFTELDSGQVGTFFAICGWGKDALLVGSFGTALRYLPPLPPPADADASP